MKTIGQLYDDLYNRNGVFATENHYRDKKVTYCIYDSNNNIYKVGVV